NIGTIQRELQSYSQTLADKEQWLVFTKADLVSEEEGHRIAASVTEKVDWKGPVFIISAASGEGVEELTRYIMTRIQEDKAGISEAEAMRLREESHNQSKLQRMLRKNRRKGEEDIPDEHDSDDEDDNDGDVEVIYRQ
ncbi:MAG: GTPase ObgE, partial [Gammaproteobacteria bacterium]|nr:GTPase ObgE [Gammaproteobacteria bacterium]